MTHDFEEFLPPRKVAALLKVSPKTVSRWATEGKLHHTVTLGGHRRFRRSDVMAVARQLGLYPEEEQEKEENPDELGNVDNASTHEPRRSS